MTTKYAGKHCRSPYSQAALLHKVKTLYLQNLVTDKNAKNCSIFEEAIIIMRSCDKFQVKARLHGFFSSAIEHILCVFYYIDLELARAGSRSTSLRRAELHCGGYRS